MADRQTEAIKAFDHEVLNLMGRGPEAFVEYMLHNHRTLQQNFTRLCFAWLVALQDQPSDLRNEASVEFARKVVAMAEADPEFTGFPMV